MHHKLSCEIMRHNPEGDALPLHASVIVTYASHGKKDIELALMAENQDGKLSARLTAVTHLPGRTW